MAHTAVTGMAFATASVVTPDMKHKLHTAHSSKTVGSFMIAEDVPAGRVQLPQLHFILD